MWTAKKPWALLWSSLALLSACGRPGQLLEEWPPPYLDARVTLTDLNQDQISDYLLCGYAKTPRKDKEGHPLTDSVVAVDGRSSQRIWGYQTQGHLAGYPTVYHDKVYVGSADHKVYALDLKTGQAQWKYTAGGALQATIAAGYGRVFVGSEDQYFYALDADTGELKWKFKGGKAFDATPALYNGTVFAPNWDGYLYALDAKTGQLKWKFKSESFFAHSTPSVDAGVVYVGSWDKNLYALSAQNGQLKWKYKTRGYLEYASPVAYKDWVFIGSNDKYFYALERQSGKLKWAFETGDAIYSTPVISDQGPYFSSRDGYLYALNFSGGLRWKYRLEGLVRSSPALAASEVLIGSPENGMVRLYDAFTQIAWGMYGGDPEHRSTSTAAAKEGELLANQLPSWWLQRRWKQLKSALQ